MIFHPFDSSDLDRFQLGGTPSDPEWFSPNSPKAVRGGEGEQRPRRYLNNNKGTNSNG